MRQDSGKMRTDKHRGGNKFFGILCLAGGLFVLFLAARGGWDLWRAQMWTATDCTVLSASGERRSSVAGKTTYYPHLLYAYRFGERDYTSDRFNAVGSYYETNDEINRALADFSAGGRFTCFVNPSNPQESVAMRGVLQFPIFRYAIALAIFFGFAALLLCGSPPRRAAKKRTSL